MAKRLLAILLALLMVIGLAACGATPAADGEKAPAAEAEEEAEEEEAEAAEPEAEAEAEDDEEAEAEEDEEDEEDEEEEEEEAGELDLSEEATVVMYQIGDEPQDLQSVLDVLNEKLVAELNTKLEFQFSTWVDWSPKYATILQTVGADMCYAASWANYALYSTGGAFMDVEPLMKNYAPDLWNWIGEDKMNGMKVHGTIYGIPNMWDEYVMQGVAYRKDLADKFEVPYPESLELAEQYFQGVHEADPDQGIIYNGASGADSTGTFVTTAGALLHYKYPEGAPNKYGFLFDYENPQQLYDYWFDDQFVEDMKMFKKWCDEGWWSRSCLSAEADQEALQNNRAIAFVSGCNANKYVGWVNEVASKDGWELGWFDYAETNGYCFPVHPNHNLTCIINGTKYPERCVKVIEYLMMNEEANKLVQCGIEGKHYNINEDGLCEMIEDSGYGYEACDTWQLRNADFKLQRPTDTLLQACFDHEKELAEAREKYPDINMTDAFAEDYEPYSTEMTAVQNVISEKLNPIFAGLVDDPEAAVEEFRTEVKAAGLDTIREEFNKQWVDFCVENGFE